MITLICIAGLLPLAWANNEKYKVDTVTSCTRTAINSSTVCLEWTTSGTVALDEDCFPMDATVILADSNLEIPIANLSKGDRVLSVDADGSPVAVTMRGWLHRDPYAVQTMIDLHLLRGNTIRLTSKHLLVVKQRGLVAAENVKEGDLLMTGTFSFDWSPVVKITRRAAIIGVYNPDVEGSRLLVNGVLVSTLTHAEGAVGQMGENALDYLSWAMPDDINHDKALADNSSYHHPGAKAAGWLFGLSRPHTRNYHIQVQSCRNDTTDEWQVCDTHVSDYALRSGQANDGSNDDGEGWALARRVSQAHAAALGRTSTTTSSDGSEEQEQIIRGYIFSALMDIQTRVIIASNANQAAVV